MGGWGGQEAWLEAWPWCTERSPSARAGPSRPSLPSLLSFPPGFQCQEVGMPLEPVRPSLWPATGHRRQGGRTPPPGSWLPAAAPRLSWSGDRVPGQKPLPLHPTAPTYLPACLPYPGLPALRPTLGTMALLSDLEAPRGMAQLLVHSKHSINVSCCNHEAYQVSSMGISVSHTRLSQTQLLHSWSPEDLDWCPGIGQLPLPPRSPGAIALHPKMAVEHSRPPRVFPSPPGCLSRPGPP